MFWRTEQQIDLPYAPDPEQFQMKSIFIILAGVWSTLSTTNQLI